MGPLANLETARWNTHDWFFQLLHAKQMEGQYICWVYDMSLETFIYAMLCFS